jgi:hypothetical protein
MGRFIALTALVVLLLGVSSQGLSQDRMGISVAGEVFLPAGAFGDAYNTGFGGDAQFLYLVDEDLYSGVMTGYYTWSGKTDVVSNLSGIPLRGLLKYRFSELFYIIAEAGVFFSWTSDITFRGFAGPSTIPGKSGTDFSYAGGFGFQVSLSESGSISLDGALRYEGAAMDGVASNNVGIRLGLLIEID